MTSFFKHSIIAVAVFWWLKQNLIYILSYLRSAILLGYNNCWTHSAQTYWNNSCTKMDLFVATTRAMHSQQISPEVPCDTQLHCVWLVLVLHAASCETSVSPVPWIALEFHAHRFWNFWVTLYEWNNKTSDDRIRVSFRSAISLCSTSENELCPTRWECNELAILTSLQRNTRMFFDCFLEV